MRSGRAGEKALTLIELLVVVAVIAILAAIAIPNFLEAQVRSKVAASAAGLRTVATALESYAVDHSRYPASTGGVGTSVSLNRLLEPREYLTSLPRDPFIEAAGPYYLHGGSLIPAQRPVFGAWVLAFTGPDRVLQTGFTSTVMYDPTNGTASRGDVVRSQRTPQR